MTAAYLPPDEPTTIGPQRGPSSVGKVEAETRAARRELSTGTEARVCADIAARQRLGIAKYGVTVEDNQLSLLEWLRHAYQECLDQAVYLRKAIEVMENADKRTV